MNKNHDVHVICVFENVPHIMVEETSLGHIKCWSLWYMNEKFIPTLNIISHYIVFLHQPE